MHTHTHTQIYLSTRRRVVNFIRAHAQQKQHRLSSTAALKG